MILSANLIRRIKCSVTARVRDDNCERVLNTSRCLICRAEIRKSLSK